MFEPEVQDLLQELLVKSEAGEVRWQDSKVAGMADTVRQDYLVVLPNISINIFHGSDGIRLNFIDSAGDISLGLRPETDEEVALLEKIFSSADRIVSGEKARKTLDDVKKALSQKGPVGELERRNSPF
ncbi:MAG TPA: hypothetical protein VEW46_17510 [Pyrinomonadaceae bacterium]|nr:hypothetical protein [Pyrinomonadaceae bacterium]